MLVIIAAAVAAGILGAVGPKILAPLPEPENPDHGKKLYQDLAATRHLSPWLGASAAILAGGVASQIEPDALIPVWVVVCGLGVLLAFIDWHTKLLPFLIVVPFNALVLLLVGLAAAVERDWSILIHGLFAAAVVYAIMWITNFAIPAAIGFGDVRLSFGLALALGAISTGAVVFGLWIGFLIGAIGAVVLKRAKIIDGREFAFGPYLILGALIGAACGSTLFNTVY